tara:strand:- start:3894 stop:5075 length:1182 start_codon:yes stop_codon:yes gene_type:complete
MKVLLISSVMPIPPVTGDRQRTWFLHRALQKFAEVDLVVVKPRAALDDEAYDEAKESWGLRFLYDTTGHTGLLGRVRRGIGRLLFPLKEYRKINALNALLSDLITGSNYDAIVVRYYHTAMIAGVLDFDTPCYLDLDDYEPSRYTSESMSRDCSFVRRFFLKRSAFQLSGHIARNLEEFSGCWIADETDRSLIPVAHYLPNIPFGISDQYISNEEFSASLSLLVISSRNRGNLEGILQFAQGALQILRTKHRELELRVVGGNLPDEYCLMLEKMPGVVMVGRVSDLGEEYNRCTMTVAPVAYGAGTSIKVLESFAYGRVCVMNQFAARGLESLPVALRGVLIANDIKHMEFLIDHFLDESVARRRASAELCNWARESRSETCFAERVQKLLNK